MRPVTSTIGPLDWSVKQALRSMSGWRVDCSFFEIDSRDESTLWARHITKWGIVLMTEHSYHNRCLRFVICRRIFTSSYNQWEVLLFIPSYMYLDEIVRSTLTWVKRINILYIYFILKYHVYFLTHTINRFILRSCMVFVGQKTYEVHWCETLIN